jgi:transketolase
MDWKQDSVCSGYSVYSLPLLGMACKSYQADQVRVFKNIVTVENHLEDGGMGSWLLESLPPNQGLRDRITLRALDASLRGTVGSEEALHRVGGLVH